MKKSYLRELKFFFLFLLLGVSFTGNSQITTTYAVGTTTNNYLPIYGFYGYSYSEQIYLASDFDVAVQGQLNEITKIRVYMNATSLNNSNDWTLYLGQTNLTSFASTTSWVTSNNMTQVFSGIAVPPSSAGWMEFILTTPFVWDGVSNVVLGVDENTPGYGSTIPWRTNATGANRGMLYYSDPTNPNPASPPTAVNRYSYVPQIQFEHNLAPACTGTPAHATLTASATSVCEGSTVDFDLDNSQFASGFTIQWQYDNGTGWTNFANSTSTVNFTATITESISVRAIRTCTNSTLFDVSDVVAITKYNAPTVVVDIPDAVLCTGDVANITASGAVSYAWTPSSGLTTANTAVVTASPTTNTTYTVTGTDVNGCIGTATSTISPISEINLNATVTGGPVCNSGVPVSIVASATPSTQFYGIWEYRFIESDGVTVLQNWNFNDTYTFTPTADSTYTFYYQVRNSGCTEYIDSVKTSVSVGFGAEVAVVDYDCLNLGGSISLSNVFGQGSGTVLYNNPMSAATSDLTFTGTASINSGRAVMTPSQTGASGAMNVNIPGFTPGANNSMTVSFDLTMDTPINTWGTGGGDGLAYSFGDDAVTSGPGPYANGKGSKLRLSFDAANNAGNQAGIYLVYGYTGSVEIPTANAATIAFSPNLASWKFLTDVPVEMKINALGQVTVTVGSTVIFNNAQLPASYLTENVSNWKHLFSAHTGGDALRQAVSNVVISSESMEYAFVPTGSTPSVSDFDYSTVKTNVQPGFYDIWIAKDSTNACSKMIGTYEVVNTNPIVDLGNDTTICSGQTLILDAGNTGATYVWSGSNNTNQTHTIGSAGAYVAYVTAANSCVGVGTINVSVVSAPTASGIYAQGNFPIVFLAATNPQNVSNYSWDFGDNTTAPNGPSSISHTYSAPGSYTVTLTVTNVCGTETYTEIVNVNDVTGLDENSIFGLEIYPNPSNNLVTIKLPENNESSARVYSMTGSLITSFEINNGSAVVDVKTWESGVYFVHVQSEDKSSVTKLIVR